MSLPFLLEIGAEEIPDWMILTALENLRLLFEKLAIPHESVTMDATPRRLVLRADGLPVVGVSFGGNTGVQGFSSSTVSAAPSPPERSPDLRQAGLRSSFFAARGGYKPLHLETSGQEVAGLDCALSAVKIAAHAC